MPLIANAAFLFFLFIYFLFFYFFFILFIFYFFIYFFFVVVVVVFVFFVVVVVVVVVVINVCFLSSEPVNDKTYRMACASSENSDQPGHPPSLIRAFAVRMKKNQVLSYPVSAQQIL